MRIENRISRLRTLLEEKILDAVLVTKEENVRYFSGFSGDSAVLLVTREYLMLVTDSRYTEQAAAEAPLYEIVAQKDGLYAKTVELTAQMGVVALGFEGGALVYDQHQKLCTLLGEISFDTSLSLDALRQIKDANEIALIRRACAIADEAFARVIGDIRPGMTEMEIAAALEWYMRRAGSERPAFQTIVASGVRGSLPHGVASGKQVAHGELVTMDFGAVCGGYHSDITRTICIGRADARQRSVYDAVLTAQQRALSAIRPGVTGAAVDDAARAVLDAQDLNQYFGHGLGHSLGLEIHEEPRLSQAGKELLQPGMLITDEPGVYIPGWGGVRIEDTVLVTSEGSEALTHAPKEFIEICL